MLSAAVEAGLIRGRRDPRQLSSSSVPDPVVGYALYLLRTVEFEGTLDDNPYLGSLGIDSALFPMAMTRVPGIALRAIGGVREVEWRYPSLAAWGTENLAVGA